MMEWIQQQWLPSFYYHHSSTLSSSQHATRIAAMWDNNHNMTQHHSEVGTSLSFTSVSLFVPSSFLFNHVISSIMITFLLVSLLYYLLLQYFTTILNIILYLYPPKSSSLPPPTPSSSTSYNNHPNGTTTNNETNHQHQSPHSHRTDSGRSRCNEGTHRLGLVGRHRR